jgi:cytochrome c-type biogenesis protein CcmH
MASRLQCTVAALATAVLLTTGAAVLHAAWAPEAAPPAAASEEERRYALLEAQLKQQPGDDRALILKALMDMDAGRFDAGAAGFEKALAGRSKAQRDPDVWVRYAEAVAMTQGRTLAGKPLALIGKALALDPHHAQALDLAGSAAWEQRDFRQAASHWRTLLAQLPTGTPRHAEVALAIERAEQRARVSLPPAR